MEDFMKYFKLFRVKHYIKNFLIFFPMIYAAELFNYDKLLSTFWVFISFSLLASAVYIFNDMLDVSADRMHPVKKNRPIASRSISIRTAIILFISLIVASLILNLLFIKNNVAIAIQLTYLFSNFIYTMYLKKVPILELFIIVLGFMLRVFIGGVIVNIAISEWLYLTIFSMSLYLAIGKRRNELSTPLKSRKVLENYNYNFLDKFMYISLTMTLVFYSLWTIFFERSTTDNLLIWTVPLVVVITMKYSLDIENKTSGDPAEVLFSDFLLLGLVALYVISIFFIVYFETLFGTI